MSILTEGELEEKAACAGLRRGNEDDEWNFKQKWVAVLPVEKQYMSTGNAGGETVKKIKIKKNPRTELQLTAHKEVLFLVSLLTLIIQK